MPLHGYAIAQAIRQRSGDELSVEEGSLYPALQKLLLKGWVKAARILQGLLYGVNSVEPVVLVTAPLVLLAASLLASVLPALRATRVNPTVALRAE